MRGVKAIRIEKEVTEMIIRMGLIDDEFEVKCFIELDNSNLKSLVRRLKKQLR